MYPELAAVVERCLDKDLTIRYSDAAELAKDLAALDFGGTPSGGIPVLGSPAAEETIGSPRLSLPEILLVIVAALALGLVIGFFAGRSTGGPEIDEGSLRSPVPAESVAARLDLKLPSPRS